MAAPRIAEIGKTNWSHSSKPGRAGVSPSAKYPTRTSSTGVLGNHLLSTTYSKFSIHGSINTASDLQDLGPSHHFCRRQWSRHKLRSQLSQTTTRLILSPHFSRGGRLERLTARRPGSGWPASPIAVTLSLTAADCEWRSAGESQGSARDRVFFFWFQFHPPPSLCRKDARHCRAIVEKMAAPV